MRAAYQQLQREGLVTISTNVGTTVVRNYGQKEIEQNIQMFYAQKKNILIDLSKSWAMPNGLVFKMFLLRPTAISASLNPVIYGSGQPCLNMWFRLTPR